MSYSNPSLYGSLYLYTYTTPLNTTSGSFTKIIGWSAGDSLNTTVSTSNNNITINQAGEVYVTFNGSFGYNSGSGTNDYQFQFFVNGSRLNQSSFYQTCNTAWGASLNPINWSCIYNAAYGDVIDVRVAAITTTTAAEPVFYLANFSVKGIV